MKNILIGSALALTLAAPVTFAGDAEAGKAKSAACAGCHGVDGTSTAPGNPHLGGQYADYLLRSLKRYKSGERQNPIMQGMVAALSEEDMEDIAAYYASQSGPLRDGTVKP